MVGTTGNGGGGESWVKGVRYMVMKEDLLLGGGYTMQYTDHVSENCTLKIYIIYQPMSPQ